LQAENDKLKEELAKPRDLPAHVVPTPIQAKPVQVDSTLVVEEIKTLQLAIKHLKLENRRLIGLDIQRKLAESLPPLPIVKYVKKFAGTNTEETKPAEPVIESTPEQTQNVDDGKSILNAAKIANIIKMKQSKAKTTSNPPKPITITQASEELNTLLNEVYQMTIGVKVVDLANKEKWQYENNLKLQQLNRQMTALKEKITFLRAEKLKIPGYQATATTESPYMIGRISIPGRAKVPLTRVVLKPPQLEKLHSIFVQ